MPRTNTRLLLLTLVTFGCKKFYNIGPRSFDVSTSGVELTSMLARSMGHLLADRPALFKLVLDEYCSARRASLARAFIDALTVGGPGKVSLIASSCQNGSYYMLMKLFEIRGL